MVKKDINVEGGELLIRSEEGHYAVIPAEDKKLIEGLIKSKCNDCVNSYISDLPLDKDYAEDGTLITDPPVKKRVQPTANPSIPEAPEMNNMEEYLEGLEEDDRSEKFFPLSKEIRKRIYEAIPPSEYPSKSNIPGYALGVVLGDNRLEKVGNVSEAKNEMNSVMKEMIGIKSVMDNNEEYIENLKKDPIKKSRELANLYNDNTDLIKKGLGLEKRYNKIKNDLFDANGGYEAEDEDMWKFYLGLDQDRETVIKSKYKPTVSKDKDSTYYTINTENLDNKTYTYRDQLLEAALQEAATKNEFPIKTKSMSGLENLTVDIGEDEKGKYVSFYDIYDFDIKGAEIVGKPYEIYDRIYYEEIKESLDPLGKRWIEKKTLLPTKKGN